MKNHKIGYLLTEGSEGSFKTLLELHKRGVFIDTFFIEKAKMKSSIQMRLRNFKTSGLIHGGKFISSNLRSALLKPIT